MSDEVLPKVLCVDDEPNLLEGLKRRLRRQYEVHTANSGMEGLSTIAERGPFPVVVSDMQMPEMDGAAFLAKARELAPDTVRMLLTGQTDIQSAISAVNNGQIFRFLTKPCSPEDLSKALEAALNQYRLIHAERELLEQTLRGSIQMLTDILSLTNPLAFGRAIRTKQRVAAIAQAMGLTERWHLEVAAMLSQIGAITLPFAVAEKVYHGRNLNAEERYMVDRLPTVALRLTGRIPRLERVREAVRWQNERYDGLGATAQTPRGEALPLGARVLKVAADFDAAEARGLTGKQIVIAMREQAGLYDPAVLNALAQSVGLLREATIITPGQLREGMVFAEDLVAANGTLLIARGQEVTAGLQERLVNLANAIDPNARIKVYADVLVSALANEGAVATNAVADPPTGH